MNYSLLKELSNRSILDSLAHKFYTVVEFLKKY